MAKYKIKYCIDCGKKLNCHACYYGTKRCYSCNSKGKRNPNYKYDKKIYKCKDCHKKICKSNGIYGKGRCLNCAMKKVKYHKHHLYLKMFKIDRLLKLKSSVHAKFHSKVYEYLLEMQGKIAIRKYLKWFIRKYGLR